MFSLTFCLVAEKKEETRRKLKFFGLTGLLFVKWKWTSYRVTFLSFFYIRGLSGRYFKLEFLLLMQEIIFFGFLHVRFDQRGFCLLYKKEKKKGSLFANCLGAWIETFVLVIGHGTKLVQRVTCSIL